MKRISLIMAAIALLLVAIATPFDLMGVPIGPFVAAILGGVAGWWAAQATGIATAQKGAAAGALAGIGALIGAVVALALAGWLIGSLPAVQELVRSSEPHPEARIPAYLVGPAAALGGGVVGLVLGLVDLIAATVGGLLAALLYGRNHPAAHAPH